MSTTTIEKKKSRICPVSPFGIEADGKGNGNVFLKSIPNCNLRSRVKQVRMIIGHERDPQTLERMRKPVSGGMVRDLPANIPGMQLHVNPKDCTYLIIDPLFDDQDTLDRIQAAVEAHKGMRTGKKLRGVPKRGGTISTDSMKTLIREILCVLESNNARVCKGTIPDRDDVDDLPGDYLLEPANRGKWNRPRYEKDLPEWVQTLNQLK